VKALTKAVAITGGGRGIGAATARALAESGCRVVIGDLDHALAKETAGTIAAATGAQVIGGGLDVADAVSFATFLDFAERSVGPLDVLINNAGIMPVGAFLDEPDTVTDHLIAINLRGVITGTRMAGQLFRERGRGHVINIASGAGMTSVPGIAVYCATKFGVVGLQDALAHEFAEYGVQVTTICPSFVNTELMSGLTPNAWMARTGVIEPQDVARAIVRVVHRGKSGVVTVPRANGAFVRLLGLTPAKVRNGIYKASGMHEINLHPDQNARAQYRARTEPGRGNS
jgi:NAD(P)-dependent dehydrogenase (short-subunit alcohol dehydrogenase family)